MSGLSKFLLIIFAALAITSCAPPSGNIDNSGGQLLAVAHRMTYEINDLFMRHLDLSVFAPYRGAMLPIAINKVSIAIAEDPWFPEDLIPVPRDTAYIFTSEGRKLVVVTYNKQKAQYSINVEDPLGIGDPNGNGGGGGGGIGVKWWDAP